VKPRVFVSSAFYDLKYIREDLSNFIKAQYNLSVFKKSGKNERNPFDA